MTNRCIWKRTYKTGTKSHLCGKRSKPVVFSILLATINVTTAITANHESFHESKKCQIRERVIAFRLDTCWLPINSSLHKILGVEMRNICCTPYSSLISSISRLIELKFASPCFSCSPLDRKSSIFLFMLLWLPSIIVRNIE